MSDTESEGARPREQPEEDNQLAAARDSLEDVRHQEPHMGLEWDQSLEEPTVLSLDQEMQRAHDQARSLRQRRSGTSTVAPEAVYNAADPFNDIRPALRDPRLNPPTEEEPVLERVRRHQPVEQQAQEAREAQIRARILASEASTTAVRGPVNIVSPRGASNYHREGEEEYPELAPSSLKNTEVNNMRTEPKREIRSPTMPVWNIRGDEENNRENINDERNQRAQPDRVTTTVYPRHNRDIWETPRGPVYPVRQERETRGLLGDPTTLSYPQTPGVSPRPYWSEPAAGREHEGDNDHHGQADDQHTAVSMMVNDVSRATLIPRRPTEGRTTGNEPEVHSEGRPRSRQGGISLMQSGASSGNRPTRENNDMAARPPIPQRNNRSILTIDQTREGHTLRAQLNDPQTAQDAITHQQSQEDARQARPNRDNQEANLRTPNDFRVGGVNAGHSFGSGSNTTPQDNIRRNLTRLGRNTDRPGNNSNPTRDRQEAAGSPYREVPRNILAKMTRKPVCLQNAEEWDAFKDSFTDYMKLQEAPEEAWIGILMTFLSPELQQRVRALNLTADELRDQKIAIRRITEVMRPASSKLGARIQLSSVAQGERPLLDFANDIRLKARSCNFGQEIAGRKAQDAAMLSSLICGIRDQDAAFEILKADVDSFEKGLRIAHDIESAKKARVNTGQHVRQEVLFEIQASRLGREATAQLIDDQKRVIEELRTRLDNAKHESTTMYKRDYSDYACFHCSQKGHLKRQCPLLKKEKTLQRRSYPRQMGQGYSEEQNQTQNFQ